MEFLVSYRLFFGCKANLTEEVKHHVDEVVRIIHGLLKFTVIKGLLTGRMHAVGQVGGGGGVQLLMLIVVMWHA